MKTLHLLLYGVLPALMAMLLPLCVSADQTSETDFASTPIPHVEELSESCPEISTLAFPPQQTDRSWLWAALIASSGAILSAVLTAVLAHWFACRQESRSCRTVAWVILDGLRREVAEGIEILNSIRQGVLSGNDSSFTPMPTVFWETHSKSLNGRVLEAICRAAKKSNVGENGPHPREFLVRTTNHYQVTCSNVNLLGRNKTLSPFGIQEFDHAIHDSSELLSLLTTLCRGLNDAQ